MGAHSIIKSTLNLQRVVSGQPQERTPPTPMPDLHQLAREAERWLEEKQSSELTPKERQWTK